jgi:aminoglycoside phosphotransferase
LGTSLEEALAENHMNKIRALFDVEFAKGLFQKEILPQYPEFFGVSRVEINPYKEMVWETTYHVVIGFKVYFLKKSGEEELVPVVCSAHSNEPRENVFNCLKYLWAEDFPNEHIDIPKPLFYSKHFNATFYRAVEGENLLYYIKKEDRETVEKMIVYSAQLFAHLHSLPAKPEANFNPINARIRTVVPGIEVIFREMSARYNNRHNEYLIKVYDYFMAEEEKFFNSGEPLSLIHGDAHQENIIHTSSNKIGLIDYTDFCLGDFARDLGTFIQQLEHKAVPKFGQEYSDKLCVLFLDTYMEISGRKLDDDLRRRIKLYHHWTSVRTAIYWFLKFGRDEKRAEELLNKIKADLKL